MSDSELLNSTSPDQQAVVKADRRNRARLVAAAVIGGVVAAFALLNLNDVKVHWLVASGRTPLILVIVVAFALGVAVDRLVIFRAKRRQQKVGQSPDAP